MNGQKYVIPWVAVFSLVCGMMRGSAADSPVAPRLIKAVAGIQREPQRGPAGVTMSGLYLEMAFFVDGIDLNAIVRKVIVTRAEDESGRPFVILRWRDGENS